MKQSTLFSTFAKRCNSPSDLSRSSKRFKVDDTRDDPNNSPGPSSTAPLSINPPSFAISSTYGDSPGSGITNAAGLDLLFFNPFLKAPGRKLLFEYLLQELPWYRVRDVFSPASNKHTPE